METICFKSFSGLDRSFLLIFFLFLYWILFWFLFWLLFNFLFGRYLVEFRFKILFRFGILFLLFKNLCKWLFLIYLCCGAITGLNCRCGSLLKAEAILRFVVCKMTLVDLINFSAQEILVQALSLLLSGGLSSIPLKHLVEIHSLFSYSLCCGLWFI